jgi:hypothetical protein
LARYGSQEVSMSRYIVARFSNLAAEPHGGRPIFDVGDALNVNVSESCLVGARPGEHLAQSFESPDETEKLRDAKKP